MGVVRTFSAAAALAAVSSTGVFAQGFDLLLQEQHGRVRLGTLLQSGLDLALFDEGID